MTEISAKRKLAQTAYDGNICTLKKNTYTGAIRTEYTIFVFGVTVCVCVCVYEFKSEVKIAKFEMADPIWNRKFKKSFDLHKNWNLKVFEAANFKFKIKIR